MKVKTTILSAVLVGLFAVSTGAFAWGGGDRGYGCHSKGGGGGAMGDNTRGRSGGVDRSNEELNHDNGLQGAENASASERGHGTSISHIARGEPTNPENTFNKDKEEMMDHD
ncbi:MAG: hypothetical protein JSR17_05745 [Proteobacteria bacterium]|nr:hypothetical protein [Pseudomonadota bacterium]